MGAVWRAAKETMNRYDWYMLTSLILSSLMVAGILTIMHEISRQEAIEKTIIQESVQSSVRDAFNQIVTAE